jgi:uncharacterized protein
MKYLRFVVMLLMVIGALNWGLIGFFKYNLVADIFGMDSALTRLIYSLVGIAGLFGVAALCKSCCCCCGGSCGSKCGCGCCKKGQEGPGQHHQM